MVAAMPRLAVLFLCFSILFDQSNILQAHDHVVLGQSVFEKKDLCARFIKKTDPKITSLANMTLPQSWWSRTYEYAWAVNFLGPNLVVLDAACGICHPFKWVMTKTCQETWACDLDSRIQDKYMILDDTYRDFGPRGAFELLENPEYLNKTHLVNCSICQLPDFLPKFDRIFCISTLEHMTKIDRQKALREFCKKLKPNGLVVLTMDYPVVPPEELIEDATQVGLELVGDVDYHLPYDALTFEPDNLTSSIRLNVFRCVLKHKQF